MNKTFILIVGLFLIFSPLASTPPHVKLEISSLIKNKDILIIKQKISVKALLGEEFLIPAAEHGGFQFRLKVTNYAQMVGSEDDLATPVLLEGEILIRENNQFKLLSNPQVLTRIGKEAIFTTYNKEGKLFQFKILPVEIF